jgi:hypothetical protein
MELCQGKQSKELTNEMLNLAIISTSSKRIDVNFELKTIVRVNISLNSNKKRLYLKSKTTLTKKCRASEQRKIAMKDRLFLVLGI